MASAISARPQRGKTVATLRAGDELDGVFACTRKDRQISRAGTPYLTVELRDSTGSILARAFRDADLLAGRFQEGELVSARGRVERFREQLQVELRSIASARGEHVEELAPERFLPTSRRDLDELEGFLEHLAREVYEPPLQALLAALLGEDELRAQIRRAPCAIPQTAAPGGGGGARAAPASSHHAYLGGLLEHTVAVATLATELTALHPRLDRDLLLSAALVHDLGKTREYTYTSEIARSREGRMLGHIELGLRLIGEYTPRGIEPERRLALEHCVLLHHGADATAGRRFASPEALALFRLNALDAQVKGALEHGL